MSRDRRLDVQRRCVLMPISQTTTISHAGRSAEIVRAARAADRIGAGRDFLMAVGPASEALVIAGRG